MSLFVTDFIGSAVSQDVHLTVNPYNPATKLVKDGVSAFYTPTVGEYMQIRLPRELFEETIGKYERLLLRMIDSEKELVFNGNEAANNSPVLKVVFSDTEANDLSSDYGIDLLLSSESRSFFASVDNKTVNEVVKSLWNSTEGLAIIVAIIIFILTTIVSLYLHRKTKPGSSTKTSQKIKAGRDVVGDVVGRDKIIHALAPKEVHHPEIHLNQMKKGGRLYAELYNSGNEPISELEVNMEWVQDGQLESRMATHFFNETENPITQSSHDCKFMKHGERKIISHIPPNSDEGRLRFSVKGVGIKSKKTFDTSFVIQNEKRKSKKSEKDEDREYEKAVQDFLDDTEDF